MDPVWRHALVVALTGESSGSLGESLVYVARDDRHLFLLIRCELAAGATYREPLRPRPRDADLADMDRVELRLDVDRDRATYWRLVVDHRGWTLDACGDDPSWDPTWYVASRLDPTHWTVEAAIPLSELTLEPIGKSSAWCFAASRIAPQAGGQNWPPSDQFPPSPQHYGYLLFAEN